VEEILYQLLTIGNYEKEKPLVTMGNDGIIMGFFHGINHRNIAKPWFPASTFKW
jgi:hypothetical protein